MENQKSKLLTNRKSIIALLLSILSPGLGHIYAGKLTKGFILSILLNIFIILLIIGGLCSSFTGLIILLTVSIVLNILIAIDSIILAKKNSKFALKPYNRWYYYILFYILLCCLSFFSNRISKIKYRNYQITSLSMENTLLKGDYVYCDKLYYKSRTIHQNDIIVYTHSESKKHTVHRVIGLPEDQIEIKDKIIYINNEVYETEFIKFIDSRIIQRGSGRIQWDTEFMGSKDNFGPIIVPKNHYFVLGDNYDISGDSRYWGFVPKEDIIGKPIYIYLSYGEKPINDYREFINLSFSQKKEFRKSRIGMEIE